MSGEVFFQREDPNHPLAPVIQSSQVMALQPLKSLAFQRKAGWGSAVALSLVWASTFGSLQLLLKSEGFTELRTPAPTRKPSVRRPGAAKRHVEVQES